MIRYALALLLLLSLALPATAMAQATDDCPMTPTIGIAEWRVEPANSRAAFSLSRLTD